MKDKPALVVQRMHKGINRLLKDHQLLVQISLGVFQRVGQLRIPRGQSAFELKKLCQPVSARDATRDSDKIADPDPECSLEAGSESTWTTYQ
jgi:hypothetical protein